MNNNESQLLRQQFNDLVNKLTNIQNELLQKDTENARLRQRVKGLERERDKYKDALIDSGEAYSRLFCENQRLAAQPVVVEPNWKAGDTWSPEQVPECDHWQAGIYVGEWGNRIVCYGKTQADAEALRDRVLFTAPPAQPVAVEQEAAYWVRERGAISEFKAPPAISRTEKLSGQWRPLTYLTAPPAQARSADLDAAKRLRRVCKLVGLADAIPDDDAQLIGVLFSILGMIARKLETAQARPAVPGLLKGIGKINGDGWKDTTTIGELVIVWDQEMQSPYAPGQYPRLGNTAWSASTEQYDFSPATREDVDSYVEQQRYKMLEAGRLKATAPAAQEQEGPE